MRNELPTCVTRFGSSIRCSLARTIIVIDDVMTTGSTVSECARVLKKAGAERVWAATVARTLKGAVLPGSTESEQEEVSEAAGMAVSV